MRKILQLDGGGVKGIIPALVLNRLEALLVEKGKIGIADSFDQVLGTSTGAIIGGCVAAGVNASELVKFYKYESPKLFKPRSWLNPAERIRGKYDREPFLDFLRSIRTRDGVRIGDLTLGQLEKRKKEGLSTSLMVTAFNMCSQRTHFIKSSDPRDHDRPLADVISWSSLSAVHYFGGIPVHDYVWKDFDPLGHKIKEIQGAYFQDGGQGYYNSTISYALTEILARGDGEATIFSVGTGDQDFTQSYKNIDKKPKAIYELWSYLTNQAIRESVVSQVLSGHYVAALNSNVNFTRWDVNITAKMNGIDKIKYLPQYEAMGLDLAAKVVLPFPINS